jgi:hypothetical protein
VKGSSLQIGGMMVAAAALQLEREIAKVCRLFVFVFFFESNVQQCNSLSETIPYFEKLDVEYKSFVNIFQEYLVSK